MPGQTPAARALAPGPTLTTPLFSCQGYASPGPGPGGSNEKQPCEYRTQVSAGVGQWLYQTPTSHCSFCSGHARVRGQRNHKKQALPQRHPLGGPSGPAPYPWVGSRRERWSRESEICGMGLQQLPPLGSWLCRALLCKCWF